MTMIEMKKYDDTTTNAMPTVADRLPPLNEEEIRWAQSPPQKSWAYNNLSAGLGYVWHMPEVGIVMQVTSDDTMRLLTLVDHEHCIHTVACIKATLDSLGLNLDLSQVVLRPYVEKDEEEARANDHVLEAETAAVEVV